MRKIKSTDGHGQSTKSEGNQLLTADDYLVEKQDDLPEQAIAGASAGKFEA